MLLIHESQSIDRDRTEQFRRYSHKVADGEVLIAPRYLNKHDRRLYVRCTMREDHQFRIANRPEGAQRKFDKLADDLWAFFRGTALLYYRDYAGSDSELPIVLSIGDVHPENYGVLPNADGAPIFAVDDFDEASFAPFTYDVKRGATSFYLRSRLNGYKKKKCRKVVRAFVNGYLEGLKRFARDDREKWHQFRIDNSPSMIRDLLKQARTHRRQFLAEYLDIERRRFIPYDEIVPRTGRVAEFQQAVDTYYDDLETDRDRDYFEVFDVAEKKDSGTASLGLPRYWVLIRGEDDLARTDVILEMKQARRSALYGVVPNDEDMADDDAAQIVRSKQIHLVGGDPLYGRTEIDGHSYLVRERSPFKDDIDVDDLDHDEMLTYAAICGEALAQTHARSDEDTGVLDGNAEQKILSTIKEEVFIADMSRFAHQAAKRIQQDYKLFKKDHALGSFTFFHHE